MCNGNKMRPNIGKYLKSIPYSQALRLKRICTTKENFTKQSKVLIKWLVERSYNENRIQQQFSKTFTIARVRLPNQKNRAASSRVPLIFTYDGTLLDIKRLVSKHWDILKINRDFKQKESKKQIPNTLNGMCVMQQTIHK